MVFLSSLNYFRGKKKTKSKESKKAKLEARIRGGESDLGWRQGLSLRNRGLNFLGKFYEKNKKEREKMKGK